MTLYEFAIGHGMNPFDASTWTDDYREKLKKLKSSFHDIDVEFAKLKKVVEENSEYINSTD